MQNFVLDNASEQDRRTLSRAGDRRVSPRESVRLPGLLILSETEAANCVIVDRSLEGFRIELDGEIVIDPQFLMIDVMGGVGHEATTAWRKDGFVGARSIARHDLHSTVEGAGALMQAAWKRLLA